MKKILIIALVVAFVVAFTGVAFAAGKNVGGYMDPTTVAPSGESPHGNYTATSNKCKACHAVHGAKDAGEALLRSTKANACVFCHFSATYTTKQPYGLDAAYYTTDSDRNHAAAHETTSYNGCVSCHSVHGAGTIAGSKILKTSPGSGVSNNTTGALTAAAGNLEDFCRDCHDGTAGLAGSTANNALTSCGSTCHSVDGDGNAQLGVTQTSSRDFVSHVMGTNVASGSGGSNIVNTGTNSSTCKSCHSGGDGSDANNFPHYTTGQSFLMDTHTTTSPLDRVCLSCHQWSSGTAGVGETF